MTPSRDTNSLTTTLRVMSPPHCLGPTIAGPTTTTNGSTSDRHCGEETLADVLRGSRTLRRAPRHAQGGSAGDRSRWDHARSDPPQRRWPTLHVVVLPPRPAGVGTPPLTQGAPRDKNA